MTATLSLVFFLSGVLPIVTAFRQWRRNVLVHCRMKRANEIDPEATFAPKSWGPNWPIVGFFLDHLSQIFWILTIVVSTLCVSATKKMQNNYSDLLSLWPFFLVRLPSHIHCRTCIKWSCDQFGGRSLKNIFLNVFGKRFSSLEYAACFYSYRVPLVVVEMRNALLNSCDDFSSRYFARSSSTLETFH